MTRRFIAFPVKDGFLVSQEFNGDRNEMTNMRSSDRHSLRVNWPTVVALFIGCNNRKSFAAAVAQAEAWYGYAHISCTQMSSLPVCEEIWVVKDGSLTLDARYGEKVIESEDPEYWYLQSNIAASLHKTSTGKVFMMLDGLNHLPFPYREGSHNYTSRDLAWMTPGDISCFSPLLGNKKPVCTELVRLI